MINAGGFQRCWDRRLLTTCLRSVSENIVLILGKTVVICATSACGYWDEGRHNVAGGGTISQDIHSETWKCQVITITKKYKIWFSKDKTNIYKKNLLGSSYFVQKLHGILLDIR